MGWERDAQVGRGGGAHRRRRAVAGDIFRLAQPGDVRGDGGRAARIVVVGVPAVMSAKVGRHARWIEQQSLVLRVEQRQVSRIRVQGCSWGKPNIK